MFLNFNTKDNAVSNLDAGIGASTTSLTVTLGQGAVFPTTNSILTIVQYNTPADPTSGVLKFEKVLMTSRSGDILTVTRGYDGTTATTFLSGDYIYLNVVSKVIEDIQDEVVRLEDDKLNSVGWLRTGLTASSIMRTNGAGEEVSDALSTISPNASDTVIMNRGWDLVEATFSSILSATSQSITDTSYETTIAEGDLVWQLFDGLYKVQAEVKTSTAYGSGNTYKDHCLVSLGKYLMVYEFSSSLYAVIASISNDVVTYGSPVNIGSAVNPTAKCALINTDKVVITYCASSSIAVRSVIGTISGTWITLGTELLENEAGNGSISNVFKVRTDVYAYCGNAWTNSFFLKINTVSGTTITSGTRTWYVYDFSWITWCYLSDNTIWLSNTNKFWNNQKDIFILAINPVWTNTLTTYTGLTTGIFWQGLVPYLARYSDTEVIFTNSWGTERSIFTIPPSGTALVKTTLTANAAANYPVFPIATNIYGVNTGSSILVYQRDILIGTITGTPAHNTNGITYNNGRILFFSWGMNIPNIVSLARIFLIWVATNNLGWFATGSIPLTKSGVIKWYRYYIQSDGSISNGIGATNTVNMGQFFGRGVLTDRISV